MEKKPFYFVFGNWEGFPYQNTYLIVYAQTKRKAIEKYRKHYPDVHENVVCCSAYYTEKEWHGSTCQMNWEANGPVEIID